MRRILAAAYNAVWSLAVMFLVLGLAQAGDRGKRLDLVAGALEPPPPPLTAPPNVTVHFAPGPDCEAEIVARLAGARKSVRVLAYSFTSGPIARALLEARARGVDVAVVMDKDEGPGRGSQLAALRAGGVSVALDAIHPIMHDKVVVVDEATVLAGSYNFSAQASRNAENLLTVESPLVAARYLADWARHKGHANP